MQRLNKKKGFSVVEVLCAISVMSILSLFIINIQLNNLRLRNYSKEKVKYIAVLEAVKQEILYNSTYEELIVQNNQHKNYIDKDKLSLSSLKTLNLDQIFSESCNINNTYIKLNLTTGEVISLELELHLKFNQSEEIIKTSFSKGDYL